MWSASSICAKPTNCSVSSCVAKPLRTFCCFLSIEAAAGRLRAALPHPYGPAGLSAENATKQQVVDRESGPTFVPFFSTFYAFPSARICGFNHFSFVSCFTLLLWVYIAQCFTLIESQLVLQGCSGVRLLRWQSCDSGQGPVCETWLLLRRVSCSCCICCMFNENPLSVLCIKVN